MHRSSRGVLLPLLLLALLVLPAAARGDDYCVSPATGCAPDHTFATFDPAVSAANSHTGHDRVLLGAAPYDHGSFQFNVGSDIELVGAGQGRTILTSTAGTVMGLA